MHWLLAWRAVAHSDFIVDSRGRVRALALLPAKPALLGLAATGALSALAPQPGSGSALIAATRAAVQDAADLIRARSPGIRTRAHLVKTKLARPAQRQARAAPRLRRPAPPAPPPAALPALLTPPPAALPLTFGTPPPATDYAGPFAGAFPLISPGPEGLCCLVGLNPPLTTVGGVVFGPPPPPPTGGGGEMPPPPGVPEPSMWTAMILGFGLVGAAWRRRRRFLVRLLRLPLLFGRPAPMLAYAPAD